MSNTLNFFAHSFARGRRLQEAGKRKEAARLFDRLGHHDLAPEEIALEALISLGRFQLEMDKPETARATASLVCARDPHSADAFVLLSEACLAGDDADLEQAHDALCQAAELDPSSASIRAELGKVQIALGMETEGLVSIEIAVELESKNPLYLRDLIDALMDLGREEEATRRARNAIFLNPRIQGFQTLWNDLRFCLTADELESETNLSPLVPKETKKYILPFKPPAAKSAGRVSQRVIRQDAPSELAAPHKHLPFIKPDRRLA